MSPDTAEVRRFLNAAPEKVFAAFADAEMVSRWLSPSPEIQLVVQTFDFRIGGAYRYLYRVPGGQTMVVSGTYLTIEPPHSIVFSWHIEPPDEHAGTQSQVTVDIAPSGTGTTLHIRHTQLTQAGSKARHADGWRGAFERLAALLEGNAPRAH
jgi:uncharacterized protein YndB with AHSA1/START domain